jgi:hypothetical protein
MTALEEERGEDGQRYSGPCRFRARDSQFALTVAAGAA